MLEVGASMDAHFTLVEVYYIVNLGATVDPLWAGLEDIIDGLEYFQNEN